MRPSVGQTFGGRYELLSRIAIGGMGEVWEASDLVIGRHVAIKILKDEYLGDPGFLERFRAEARHAALVNHEGIANVFDYGEEDGSAFLVMELVPGEALSTVLEREHVLSTDKVLDIIGQTSAALQAAHAAGLVHRDIKPGNLLLTPDGHVKITDFGIARITDQVPLTATGQVMGTVQYLSPEQASGHPASPTTDLYSLGIVAYEALAGRRPFTGESQVAIAMAQINDTPPPLPVTVSDPVRNLVYACIAKNPIDRPQTAAHLARAAHALRLGDVTAAAAAVPSIIGGAGAAATMLIPQQPGVPATTQAFLPPIVPAPESTHERERQRSPWTWPLIALVAILALVLGGTVWALIANRGTTAPPATTSSQPSASASATKTSAPPSPTPTPTPSPTATSITEDDFKGQPSADARKKLEQLGYIADIQVGTPAAKPDDVDKVYKVNPTGPLPSGSKVTLLVYGPVETPAKATSPKLQSGGTNVLPFTGAPTVIVWDVQTCPAGQALTEYQLTVTPSSAAQGAAIITQDKAPGGSRSAQVNQGQPGTFTATLTYSCNNVASPASAPLTVTVGP